MKLAVSNLALPPFNHVDLLPRLGELGIRGIEVAPDHTWRRTLHSGEFSFQSVWDYRRAAEGTGLEVIGLHALLGGRLEFGLFEDHDDLDRTIAHLVHLSAVCRDLGGKTLTLDSRWRAALPIKDAWLQCRDFLEMLLPEIEDHGTTLCFAPMAENDGDFCLTARECHMLSLAIDHPAFGLSLDSAPLTMRGETGHAHFICARGRLKIFHVDEPQLVPIGSSGAVDHGDMRQHLAAIGYRDWISVVQRYVPGRDPLDALAESAQHVKSTYLRTTSRSVVSEIEATRVRIISDTIDSIRPRVQADGGDMELVSVSGNRVEVKLSGKCVGCALAGQTLGGVRRQLMSVLNTPVVVVPV